MTPTKQFNIPEVFKVGFLVLRRSWRKWESCPSLCHLIASRQYGQRETLQHNVYFMCTCALLEYLNNVNIPHRVQCFALLGQ